MTDAEQERPSTHVGPPTSRSTTTPANTLSPPPLPCCGTGPTPSPEKEALFLLVHWGYGSAVGIEYIELLRKHSTARATVEFYLLCQAMAMTLFPTLGGTPPPWRWPRRILISSLCQHAVYAVVVAASARAVTTRR